MDKPTTEDLNVFEENRNRAMRHSLYVRFQMVKNHREYGKEIEKFKPVEVSYDELEWLILQSKKLEAAESWAEIRDKQLQEALALLRLVEIEVEKPDRTTALSLVKAEATIKAIGAAVTNDEYDCLCGWGGTAEADCLQCVIPKILDKCNG